MIFVSHAPNFEDVMLWRALRHWAPGRYMDVGAGAGAVTQAFYDRLWSGIDVTDEMLDRPRDTIVTLGQETLAASAEAGDLHVLRTTVPDFLSDAVLARLQPRIVLAQGTPPGSAGEACLYRAGYRFAWFDGSTRFYLAPGHAALQRFFEAPPHAEDDFIRAGTVWATRLALAEAAHATATRRATRAESQAAIDGDRAEAAQLRLNAASADAARLLTLAEQNQQALARLEADANAELARAQTAISFAHAAAHSAQAQTGRVIQDAGALTAQTAEHARQAIAWAEAAMAQTTAQALSAIRSAADAAQTAAEQAALAERRREDAMQWLAAMRGSTSWRITGPLRRALARQPDAGGPVASPAIALAPFVPPTLDPPPSLVFEPPTAPDGPTELPTIEPFGFEPLVAERPPVPEPPPPPRLAAQPIATPPPALPLFRPRAVHQFCAGPHPDGPLLHAMLITQRALRGLGYDSHIFVDTPDYGLIHAAHTLAALPDHGRYVLILHSAARQPIPQAVLDLPVPKILFHHGSLELAPGLAGLRTAVVTALADTELGTLALRRLGYPSVSTISLWPGSANAAAPTDDLFTVLCLARPNDPEAAAWLQDAFARFQRLDDSPSALVMPGADGVHPPASLAIFANTLGEADPWPIQAMAAGLPTLARATGAIPYLFGTAPGLVFDPASAAMAAAIVTLAQDRTTRLQLGQAQRSAVHASRADTSIPALLAALAQAGAAPMPAPATLDAVAAHAQVTLAGPVSGGSGAAQTTRSWAAALETARPGAVRLVPVEAGLGGETGLPGAQHPALRPLLSRPPPSGGPHVSITHHDPVISPPEPSDVALALFVGEASLVPPTTVRQLDAHFHGVLTESVASAKALIDSGVRRPVRIAGSPPEFATLAGRFAAQLLLQPEAEPPRPTAWITTWDVPCGIADYSRYLRAAMPGPAVILCDTRTPPPSGPGPHSVIPVWAINEPDTLHATMRALMRHDPPCVVIQHQPGLMPWPMLIELLNHPALAGRVVSITLHNTEELATATPAFRAAALAALARLSRVVVHGRRDIAMLAGFGLTHNTTVIPQGAELPVPGSHFPSQAVRHLSSDSPVVIGSYGFFLPGKGLPELIEALALLRQHWPYAVLRLINAEYPVPQSSTEIATCRALVTARGLEDAVLFETGLLDHADSTARLQQCDVLVLPYQGSREGSSAALRSALRTGIAVVVTPLALFEEAGPATLTLPGCTPEQIAAGLDAVLRNTQARTAATEASQAWLQERSWARIGHRFSAMLDALHASGVVVDGIPY